MVEIGSVLTQTSDSGEPLFTDEEKKKARKQLAEFPKNPPEERLKFITWLLKEQEEEFHERISAFTIPSMYEEPEPEDQDDEEQASGDYNAEDDIPWGEDEDPGEGKAGAKETAEIRSGAELDIF
jgi:hypothetical protein